MDTFSRLEGLDEMDHDEMVAFGLGDWVKKAANKVVEKVVPKSIQETIQERLPAGFAEQMAEYDAPAAPHVFANAPTS